MTGQVILSIAYGIDVQDKNYPYVADAENMLQAVAVGSTQEAALLDAVPWCITAALSRGLKTDG